MTDMEISPTKCPLMKCIKNIKGLSNHFHLDSFIRLTNMNDKPEEENVTYNRDIWLG